jgi:hypothetical protein
VENLILTIVICTFSVILCSFFGYFILIKLNFKQVSLFGTGFILGYSLFAFLLLISLKIFGNYLIGAITFISILIILIKFTDIKKENIKIFSLDIALGKNRAVMNPFIFISLITYVLWVIMLIVTYMPLALQVLNTNLSFPDIFDLPKHIFAMNSLFDAKSWPSPSPFMKGESFIYNYLFYCPGVFLSKILGNQINNLTNFAILAIIFGASFPLFMLDITKIFGRSIGLTFGTIIFSTWAGGVVPLLTTNKPSLGFMLFLEKKISSLTWVEEPFTYLIFVPQHTLSVLCGLLSFLLILEYKDKKDILYIRILLSGLLTIIAILSSFILIPHLIATYIISIALLIYYDLLKNKYANKIIYSYKFYFSILLPTLLIIYFLFEISNFSSYNGNFLSLPKISLIEWAYIILVIGLAIPFSIVGIIASKKDIDRNLFFGLIGIVLIAILLLSLGDYPDAGLKSGLWLRVTIIPFAAYGMSIFLKLFNKKQLLRYMIPLTLIIFVEVINLPTALYFANSGWVNIDTNILNFINHVREIPHNKTILMLSSDQKLISMMGHKVDFNFIPLRDDSYMTKDGILKTKEFWDKIYNNNQYTWTGVFNNYDYLIIHKNDLNKYELSNFDHSEFGTYIIYNLKIKSNH